MPLFIFVANLMNASGVLERLLGICARRMVGRFRGGLAHVNIVANLIFSGMSGSAVADAAGPGLIVARMMTRDETLPARALRRRPRRWPRPSARWCRRRSR